MHDSVANVKGSGLSKSEYDFAKNQTWLSTTNRNLTFLDETQELISIYDRDSDPENATNTPLHWTGSAYSAPINVQHDQIQVGSPSRTRPIPSRLGSTGGSSVGDLTSPTKRRRLTFSSSYQGSMGESPGQYQHSPAASWHMPSQSGLSSTPVDSNVHDPTLDPTFATLEPTVSNTSQLGPSFTAVSENLSRVYLDAPLWPLQDKEEARLMRYFVEHLAQSFDLTDPVNHFQNVVPQRAALCPTLLNAVFAASARHLSRISDYDPLVSNRYHQECLKHLIPMLDDTASILDENLLASTVILRYLEEIEVPLSGALHYADGESHLLGTHVFITAQERSTVTGGLRQAAFWVGLRQEIYVAFVNQRSIIPALEHCNIDRSFEATDDHTWANRIVVHCADVIRYCFGDLDHTHAAYTHLVDYSSDWYNYKPPSFAPIYYRDPEGSSIFPEIWLLGDEIVTALQHWHLARILLSAHNPRVPRLGPGRAQALRTMDVRIHSLFRAYSENSLTCS